MRELKKMTGNKGFTYVELIVVLSIFATLSTVAFFNYGVFQDKVDTKNLASDIALKIVEAQKSSLGGKLPPINYTPIPGWKPAYGVYFNSSGALDADGIPYNKKFIYYTDLNNNNMFSGSTSNCTDECLEKTTIAKGSSIVANAGGVSGLNVFYQNSTTAPLTDLNLTFSRINSGVTMIGNGNSLLSNVNYVQITVISPRLVTANIKIYPSGRIQVK